MRADRCAEPPPGCPAVPPPLPLFLATSASRTPRCPASRARASACAAMQRLFRPPAASLATAAAAASTSEWRAWLGAAGPDSEKLPPPARRSGRRIGLRGRRACCRRWPLWRERHARRRRPKSRGERTRTRPRSASPQLAAAAHPLSSWPPRCYRRRRASRSCSAAADAADAALEWRPPGGARTPERTPSAVPLRACAAAFMPARGRVAAARLRNAERNTTPRKQQQNHE